MPFCFTCASIRSTHSAITSGRTGSFPSRSTRFCMRADLSSLRGRRWIGERDLVAHAARLHLLAIALGQQVEVLLRFALVAVGTRRRHHDAEHAYVRR